jgi:hypothetical protein
VWICAGIEITERNAIDDGRATIFVPPSMLDEENNNGILFNVYIRMMANSLQCMEINGYAIDGSYYFNSGTAYLSTKPKTTLLKIHDLFDVYYCF